MFNYDTWRNIALGRSKTYNKFLTLEKIEGVRNLTDFEKMQQDAGFAKYNKNLDNY